MSGNITNSPTESPRCPNSMAATVACVHFNPQNVACAAIVSWRAPCDSRRERIRRPMPSSSVVKCAMATPSVLLRRMSYKMLVDRRDLPLVECLKNPKPHPCWEGRMATDTEVIYDKAEDIGKMVKLSGKTIYRMAAQDPSFPSLRIGGSIRFPRERVLRWFREREQGRSRR